MGNGQLEVVVNLDLSLSALQVRFAPLSAQAFAGSPHFEVDRDVQEEQETER